MTSAQLTYGEARTVAAYLSSAPAVQQSDLHAALINALNRIEKLETKIARLEAENKRNIKAIAANARE